MGWCCPIPLLSLVQGHLLSEEKQIDTIPTSYSCAASLNWYSFILHRYCDKQFPHHTVFALTLHYWSPQMNRSDTVLKKHLEKQKLIFAGWLACLCLEQEWWHLKSYCCLGSSQSNFWNLHSGVWWSGPGWQPSSHTASHCLSPVRTDIGDRKKETEKLSGFYTSCGSNTQEKHVLRLEGIIRKLDNSVLAQLYKGKAMASLPHSTLTTAPKFVSVWSQPTGTAQWVALVCSLLDNNVTTVLVWL